MADQKTTIKQVNMASARLLGRLTAGAGTGEELTGTQVTTMLDLANGSTKGLMSVSDYTKLAAISGTNTGDQTITLTGVLTGSGTGSFATAFAASPSFTGTVTIPTVTADTNSTAAASTAYVQAALGITAKTTTGGATTLTAAEAGASTIILSGTLAAAATLNLGSGVASFFNRNYTIYNATTGAFTLTVQACATSPGVTLAITQGYSAEVFTNGASVFLAGNDTSSLPVFTAVMRGVVPASGGGTTNFLRADGSFAAPPNSGGTVTAIGVTTANGVSGSSSGGTTPNLTIALGAITPTSVASSGAVTGSNLSGTNTGDQTITLTGNVTGTGTGSFATVIAANAVTLANMAQVATGSVFYRKTAATGNPEVQTLATLKTDLGLTGTNSGDQTITLTGDVTGTGIGSFAATIAAASVTLAKQANLAANSIQGNNTGASATPLALTGTQVTAMLDSFTSALKGLVPASGGGTVNFLRADGTWVTPVGTTTNAATFNNSGTGAASGTTFNGNSAQTISYNTFGAAPTASPTFTGTVTIPTVTADINSTAAASTAYVQTALGIISKTTTGGVTTLTSAEAGASTILITGTLVSAATLNLGSSTASFFNRTYTIFNGTTGAFTLTVQACATSPGATLVITQGYSTEVFTNGAGVFLAGNDTSGFPVFTSTMRGVVPASGGGTTNFLRADGTFVAPTGTVSSVSVTTANGVSGAVATATTTPAITLTLGAITPTSVAASGTVTGSNLSGASSGTNTGDQTITLTGVVTGSGTGSFATAFATSPAFTGTPTSTTAAVDTNTTQIATTAYVIGQTYLKVATASSTYAPLVSPTLTGTPAAPTAAANTNTTQLATTAFVLGQANSTAVTITMNGVQAAGASGLYARADHVHPVDTSRSPTASPTFTGTVTIPTAVQSDSSTTAASTAFVQGASGLVTVVTTGGVSTLTAVQAGAGTILITGTLASSATLNFGSSTAAFFNRTYTVINNTTGAFTVTLQACVTSPTNTLTVTQGTSAEIYVNGAGVFTAGTDMANLPVFTSTSKGITPFSGGGTTNFLRADGTWVSPPNSGGTVTAVSVTTANGVSGSVANPTSTPAITLSLGAITPTSVVSSGSVTGTNLSGTNTGDQTITLTGDVTGTGTGSFAATIAAASVTLTKMANLAANSIIGNNTGAGATPLALTGTQVTAMLDSFTSAVKGLTPASGGGTTNFLRADGTWAVPPSGSGTVTSVSVTTANGVSGTVATPTSTPAISLTLGAITPTSVASTGAISGTTGSFSGSSLSLTNATSAWINYAAGGVAAPAFTTSSAGTKIVLYPQIGASSVDYAIGIETNTLWNSVPTTGSQFKWYGGTTLAATLTGLGALTLVGALAASNFSGSHSGTSSGTNTGDQTSVSGSSGSVVNSATFNNAGTGAVSGTTFNGSAAQTISYNTLGAAPLASPTFTGTVTTPNAVLNGTNTAWSATNQAQATLGSLHFTTSGITDAGQAITWASTGSTNAQAGIYVNGNGATGSSMYISTTNSYGTGPQTAISIAPTGNISFPRGTLSVNSTISASNFSGSHSGTSSGTNTGDQTITLTGDVTGTGTGSFAATVAAGAITLAKQANLAANSVQGNNTGVAATPLALTGTQVTAMLDSFTSALKGLVPASGGGTTNFLRADGTWAAPAGGAGTVTTVSVTTANGVSGTVATATTTPAITLTLGAITPTSVASTGAVTGTNLSGTNTGDQTITLTGNVTGTGTGSFATTIAANAVTLANMAQVATGTVFYRKTAATGNVETQTLATLKTDLGLTGTNSGDQTITLTGVVTGSGTGSFATAFATSPAFSGTPTAPTAAYGTSTTQLATTAFVDALRDVPQNSQTAAYTLALTDRGKFVDITTGGITVPANASVAFPIGATITIYNDSAANQNIAITTDTMYLAGTATTGTRVLAQRGLATLVKVQSTTWVISGAGLT